MLKTASKLFKYALRSSPKRLIQSNRLSMFIAATLEHGGLRSSVVVETQVVLSVWAALKRGVVHSSMALFLILELSI